MNLNIKEIPPVLSYKDLIEIFHFSRTMAYKLLNREDAPVIVIGNRRFMDSARFQKWLTKQSLSNVKREAKHARP